MKILCFHPALAPYRLGFFNILSEKTRFHLVLLQENLYDQKFNQSALLINLKARYEFLTDGFCILGRNIRIGIGRVVKREVPDIVIGYESSQTTLSLIIQRYLGRRKFRIWTMMDDSPELIEKRKGLRRLVRDFVLNHVDRVIVPTGAAKDAYRKKVPSVPEDRYVVLPIMQDTETVRHNAQIVYSNALNWRRKFVPEKWRKVLLFVGRLDPVKNLHWLVEQMKLLKEDVGLVFVGSGSDEQSVKEHVNHSGLSDRVIFTGRMEGDALFSMMAMADCLLLCSHTEPYGAVVAEAMQWGTPCVVSQNCGASVLINNGENGWVFEYNDPVGFNRAINSIPARRDHSILTADIRISIDKILKSVEV